MFQSASGSVCVAGQQNSRRGEARFEPRLVDISAYYWMRKRNSDRGSSRGDKERGDRKQRNTIPIAALGIARCSSCLHLRNCENYGLMYNYVYKERFSPDSN